MRFLQVIWAMRDGQVLPLRALLAAALVCCLWATASVAAPQGGVPSATWQDNDRNHRRSPNQIVTQLRTPQAQAGQMPLADDAQDQRAAKARNQLAAGEAPVAQDGQLNMLGPDDWRIKILSAAVTNSDMVLLGDIAVPLGQMGQDTWAQLRAQQLWPAPPEEGKPLQISHSRLSQALRQALGKEVAGRCILPSSLVIQRGGLVFHEEDLRSYVVKSLTPQLSAMPGQVELSDFRLPDYIFLAHAQQRVQLEPGKLSPGRVPLRFAVQEVDGNVLRRISGTVNLTLWITAPAASRPMNKGEALAAESVTFMKVNASQLRDLPWDGRGGPWQVNRALNTGEPILQSDLVSQLMVRRGDVVNLIYIKGNLRIATQAQALADGEPGATIAVRNLQTKKQVYAIVKDGSTVEIH
ncbi:flagellar basal body P-ring formation chaperone FlgA [Desulfovibrio desulfuricans]|uniref:flagellar basal body P-ring formation chaperone FlgA n=1 Tax=Desulfovibrio desulfuricans TaxID=876 RepID=UPI0003B46695|nr:flagellar basal body P-ring formation chaperone FlgA [Desulfovibrio desulfuricans]MDD3684683.1 flagellar basal body P-ring formation chaperone FlgA [Desulfovibrio desulfuricans]QTO39574.1 flagellar basal body P-ring formation protein FlgA [Desulfovibrio desulfuricans]